MIFKRVVSLIALLFVLASVSVSYAFWQSRDSNFNVSIAAVGCSQATTLIARMDGGQNTSAVTTLICGMVTDGTYSLLDGFYVFATNTTTNANLNWAPNASYNLSQTGSVTFVANHGYTSDGTTGFFTTGFTPSTATSPNWTQNSASIGYCTPTSSTTTTNNVPIGSSDGTRRGYVQPFVSGPGSNLNINTTASAGVTPNTNAQGTYVFTRTASNLTTAYRNGVSFGTTSTVSTTVPTTAMQILALNGGTIWPFQMAWGFYGGALTVTQVGNIRTRLNTYLTAVGGTGSC